MPDIPKHLDRAEKHLQKGRREAALREYLEVLRDDPAHATALQAAADLCLALGQTADAARLLRQIFDRQLSSGQVLAAATYRKLLRIAAVSPDESLHVARLVAGASRKEALEAYHLALRGFLDAGRKADAKVTLEAIFALDPAVETLLQIADLAADLNEPKHAAERLLQAAQMLAGTPAAMLPLYERAYALDPAEVAVALAYAGGLLQKGDPKRAAAVLQPFSRGPQATPEAAAAYGRALLLAGRARDAEPFLWQVFEHDPAEMHNVVAIIENLLDGHESGEAVRLARRLEAHQQHAGRVRELSDLLRPIAERHAGSIEFLEYMVELFNAANREQDYCATLLRLFELYYADGNFLKASECLDRAAEVDPYEDGHKRRLDMLRGKIAPNRLRAIAGRLLNAVTATDEEIAQTADAPDKEPTVLEDLLLQAEIFLQYSLRSRAAERLERIRKLFPGEEQRNPKLRDLYVAAGIMLADSADVPPPSTVRAPAGQNAANEIGRVTEITRNIYRQSTVKSVLFTTVNDAGRYFNASRCVAVMCTPGKPPSVALEYCAPSVKPSDVHAIVKLIGFLQPLVIAHGPLTVGGQGAAPGLAALKQFAGTMGISSLLAMPLIEGEEHVGLLLLGHCDSGHNWQPADMLVLKTIADQAVLAVSNVRLRNLMKNLAITEEKSGLLKRASYLDVLLSEVRRASQQNSTVSVLLLNFGKAPELVRHMGEAEVDSMMQQLGQLVCSHIRQNDLAVRYDLTTLALILADTNEKSAFLAVDKLRKVLANARVPSFSVGISEAAMQPDYDPVDIVTEVINRVETALQAAVAQGGNGIQAQAPVLYSSVSA